MDGKQMVRRRDMPDTEKITINLGSIDLGKIDLLVEEGFYSNRADFIRAAVRSLLNTHQDIVKQVSVRRSIVMGALIYDRQDLEKRRQKGEMLDLRVIGTIVLSNDIPVDLALATIQRIQIFGSLRASDAVKEALAERIHPTR
jgi:Arc/MetJ-type ribon-helix-helix transcriptional regulator